MMKLARPFPGVLPTKETAELVAAPPYDVVSEAQARQVAERNPLTFLKISRPEINFTQQQLSSDAPNIYEKGNEVYQALLANGTFIQDTEHYYYVYQIVTGDHVQTGLVAGLSVAAYNQNVIKKHELTRPVKEQDRTDHISTLEAQTGPVMIVHRSSDVLKEVVEKATALAPEIEVAMADETTHRLWRITNKTSIEQISAGVDNLGVLYIADGHHRSAAAARVAENYRQQGADLEHPSQYFLGVMFPEEELKILPYNRVVTTLSGMSHSEFLARCETNFDIEQTNGPVEPLSERCFAMYLNGHWYQAALKETIAISSNPAEAIGASILSQYLLAPVLDIKDLRNDERIDFVGGIHGTHELQRLVEQDNASVAFAVYPTTTDTLFAVADAEMIMPPKSTWFEPKLVDGLVSYPVSE